MERIDVVNGLEEIFHVQLVEPEGDVEGGVFGRQMGCSKECDSEFRPVNKVRQQPEETLSLAQHRGGIQVYLLS